MSNKKGFRVKMEKLKKFRNVLVFLGCAACICITTLILNFDYFSHASLGEIIIELLIYAALLFFLHSGIITFFQYVIERFLTASKVYLPLKEDKKIYGSYWLKNGAAIVVLIISCLLSLYCIKPDNRTEQYEINAYYSPDGNKCINGYADIKITDNNNGMVETLYFEDSNPIAITETESFHTFQTGKDTRIEVKTATGETFFISLLK